MALLSFSCQAIAYAKHYDIVCPTPGTSLPWANVATVANKESFAKFNRSISVALAETVNLEPANDTGVLTLSSRNTGELLQAEFKRMDYSQERKVRTYRFAMGVG